MNKRSAVWSRFAMTGAFLMVLGSALVIPAASAAGSGATASFQESSSATVRPVMWINCSRLSWWERLWSSYC